MEIRFYLAREGKKAFLSILLGNFFCLFCHKGGKNRSRIVTITTLWISLYALASIGFQAMARNAFRERLASQNHSDIEMLVSPTLTNIFLWRMIARDDENFYISYWSLFDAADRPVHISTIVRSDESATPYLGSKEFETLDWFSKGWWKVFPAGQDSNSIYFVDMRFGEIQNFNTDPTIRSTPFMWKLSIDAHGEITDQRTRVREELDAKAVLKQLQERIAGRAPDWHQGIWPWEIQ